MNNDIWIIGCGDIGRRVAKLYQKARIFGIMHSEKSVSSCRDLGIKAYQADFDREINLPEISASKIYYFMAPPSIGREDTRLTGFLEYIEEEKKESIKRRIVLISTTGVYGNSNGAWIDETASVSPNADRAYRRLSAEQALENWQEKTGGEYMILRVPGIYAQSRLPLSRLEKGLPIVREEEAGWTNRIHADDLAQACKAAMGCISKNEIINICDGNPSTMTDYFNHIADYSNLPRPRQISMKDAEDTLSDGMVSYLKESRRISNKKMFKLLKIQLEYPSLQSFISSKK